MPVDAMLAPEDLNQTPGYQQSLANWSITREGEDYFVESIKDRNIRFRAPDGSNFVEGVAHPPFITQKAWELLRPAMAHRASDVWVATFPKCGTTVMEQVILLLMNDGDPSRLDPASKNGYNKESNVGKVWPEFSVIVDGGGKGKGKGKEMPLSEFDSLPGRRLLKTHAPRHMFLATRPVEPASFSVTGRPAPLVQGPKVVYVSRNAKDACVSAYYHAANPQKKGFPFDAWVKVWSSGLFEHGRWSDHVAGWRAEALSNPEQVLWVCYEDLVAQPEQEIRRVATFLGFTPSDAVVSATALHSGFSAMKAQAGNASHMRKGEVGDSERHFSPELSKEFDELYAELMRGVDDPYANRGLKRSLD